MSEFKYITPQSPTLTIGLCGKDWKAVGGVLHLSAAASAELDELMLSRPDIRANIQKVDMEAAAQIARDFTARQLPAATKGPVTSVSSASAKIREARQAQRSETLTGMENPLNIATSVKADKPLAVEQIPTTPPSGKEAFAQRFSHS